MGEGSQDNVGGPQEIREYERTVNQETNETKQIQDVSVALPVNVVQRDWLEQACEIACMLEEQFCRLNRSHDNNNSELKHIHMCVFFCTEKRFQME